MGMDSQGSCGVSEVPAVLNETIHQSTRLRIMTLLVSRSESDRVAYGFIQQTLGLTGGNLTIHLRKLEDAGYVYTPRNSLRQNRAHGWRATHEGAEPSPSTSATWNARSTFPFNSRVIPLTIGVHPSHCCLPFSKVTASPTPQLAPSTLRQWTVEGPSEQKLVLTTLASL